MRIRFVLFLMLFGLLMLVWISACQAATPTTPAVRATPAGTITISVTRAPDKVVAAQAANLKGNFVFALARGSIMIQDANGANARVLVPTNGDTLAEFPTFSPDGRQVAYSFNYFDKDGLVVQDLRVINADGSNARTVIAPTEPKLALSFPIWSPDGKELYFTQSKPNPPSDEITEIDRVSVNGGAPKKVLDSGRIAAVSPDGKKIAFRRLDLKTFGSALWIANTDGSGAKELVGQDAFVDVFAARFTPDSQNIVFAASGEPKKKLPGLVADLNSSADSCAVSILFVCVVERASAHGLPADLYMVDLNGTKFDRLTRAGADSPYPAFSPDGRLIGFLSEIGIFVVDPQQKTFFQASTQGGYGGFDWR